MKKVIIFSIIFLSLISLYYTKENKSMYIEDQVNGLINKIIPLIEDQNKFILVEDIYPKFLIQEPIGEVETDYYTSTLIVENDEPASVNFAIILMLKYNDQLYEVKIWGDYTDRNDGFIMFDNKKMQNSVFYRMNDLFFSIDTDNDNLEDLKEVAMFVKGLLE